MDNFPLSKYHENGSVEEFVRNPSESTKHLVCIVTRLYDRYEKVFTGKNPFRKLMLETKINTYIRGGYLDYFSYLEAYGKPETGRMGPSEKLGFLLGEFEKLYEKLVFNNFALTYAYVRGGQKPIKVAIITKEDEKNMGDRKSTRLNSSHTT